MTTHRDGPRPAVIGTCSLAEPEQWSPEAVLGDRLDMIDRMAARAADKGWQLDVAVLPESNAGPEESILAEVAETMDGPTMTAMAQKAREHGTYVAAPVHLRRDGKVFNCVVMLDRSGEPLGVYEKAFPVTWTDGTLERGVTPGCRFPVFDLDFGRVGVQICWDIAFPEGWQALGDQGVELVLYPTYPAGLLGLRSHAWQHEYYVAAATISPPCAVVEPTGHVLATTSEDREVLVARIDLDFRVLNTNCLWEFPEQEQKKHAGRIRFDWRQDEYLYLVTSTDPDLPVGRFLKEQGLVSGLERRTRNLELIDEARLDPLERA